jgi:UDP-N-acetylmuramyl tripeptide synthase
VVASILELHGTTLVHNRQGANMAGGIAASLLGSWRRGRPTGALGLFEVDEFWLDGLVRALRPRVVLLANLFRDQLDRYGELEAIADRWHEIVADDAARTAETGTSGGRELQLLLVKNPAGANEVARTLALAEGEIDLLAVLNDRIADGRDVSWIWDADLEAIAHRVRHVTCAGTRAAEMAVRWKYAGVAPSRIAVVRDGVGPALDHALAAAPEDVTVPIHAIPTYTAMLELREELVRRGAAKGSFA